MKRCLAYLIALIGILLYLVGVGAAEPDLRVTWFGQDGHDYCQTARVLGSNDIQDLHLRIEGLPASDEIDGLLLRRDGGGEWAWKNAGGTWTWKAHVIRAAGATSADVFMEPSHLEPKFRIDAELKFSSGRVARFSLQCGESNPNLFMPGANLAAAWVGQGGSDWTGPDAGVGPDGYGDVRINLRGISTKLEVRSIVVESATGLAWEYGLNPQRHANAELVRESQDKSRGALFFNPERSLARESLTVRVTYAIDRSNSTTVVAGPFEPRRVAKPPAPLFTPRVLNARWLGQDGTGNRGDIHCVVEGLPRGRTVQAAALSDNVGGYWIYRQSGAAIFYGAASADGVPFQPFTVRNDGVGDSADLYFSASRRAKGVDDVSRVAGRRQHQHPSFCRRRLQSVPAGAAAERNRRRSASTR